MNQYTHLRKNNRFHDGLKQIREYFSGHHDQVPQELNLFWDTIFPRPEMNAYALSKKVERENV
jgi:hypothetical protein